MRIAQPLLPKRALRPMPRSQYRVNAHRPQTLPNAADQLLVVALREIGAADAAGEQHITYKGALCLR